MRGKMESNGIRFRALSDEGDINSTINPAVIMVSTILFFVGVSMLIIGNSLGDECKMEAIDKSSYEDDDKLGNLPKWFIYTGALIVLTGLWAMMSIGLIPLFCRYKCHKCGGNIYAKLMDSFCTKLILIYVVLITVICNLIGTFWIYAAKLSRTPANSYYSGDVNYCHPVLW